MSETNPFDSPSNVEPTMPSGTPSDSSTTTAGEFSINGKYSGNIIDLREFKVGDETYIINNDGLEPIGTTINNPKFKNGISNKLEFYYNGKKPGSMFSSGKIVTDNILETIEKENIKSLPEAKAFYGKLDNAQKNDLNGKQTNDTSITDEQKQFKPEIYIMFLKIQKSQLSEQDKNKKYEELINENKKSILPYVKTPFLGGSKTKKYRKRMTKHNRKNRNATKRRI